MITTLKVIIANASLVLLASRFAKLENRSLTCFPKRIDPVGRPAPFSAVWSDQLGLVR